MTINNQQVRIICRRLDEVNKMIEPFGTYMSEGSHLDDKLKLSLLVLHP
jgi:hypothetical protein